MISLPKLINEWRDSLFYSGLLFCVLVIVLGGNTVSWSLWLNIAMARELLRQFGWMYRPPQTLAGHRGPRVQPFTLACACGVVTISLNVVDVMAFTPFGQALSLPMIIRIGMVAVGTFAATIAFMLCGGLPGVVRAYETMWDWPRKRDDGGETSKLLDAIRTRTGKLQTPLASGA